MRHLQEGIFNPSTSELLARKFRTIAGKPTFKDRIGNVVGAVKQVPNNMQLGLKNSAIMITSGGKPSFKQSLHLTKSTIQANPRSTAAGTALGALALGLGGYAAHKYRKNKAPVNAAGLVRGSYVINEGIIDDAKAKLSSIGDSIGNAVGSVKNRIQTNVGNIANGITSVTDKVKGFANGIADKVSSIGNRVSDFASNTVGAKNVTSANQKPGFKIKPIRQTM